jgi:hypothetical protein
MSAGKGDKPRPVNKKEYNKNFDEINWNKPEERKAEIKNVKNKQIYVYR